MQKFVNKFAHKFMHISLLTVMPKSVLTFRAAMWLAGTDWFAM